MEEKRRFFTVSQLMDYLGEGVISHQRCTEIFVQG